MWICTNQGFVSIVETKKDKRMLQIRARKRKHLRALFPKEEIIETFDSDYRYRVVMPRVVVEAWITRQVHDLDYTNFKDSVTDPQLKKLYSKWWVDHYNIQDP